jgi:hypothetical protein
MSIINNSAVFSAYFPKTYHQKYLQIMALWVVTLHGVYKLILYDRLTHEDEGIILFHNVTKRLATRHITQDMNPQLYRCEKLISRNQKTII